MLTIIVRAKIKEEKLSEYVEMAEVVAAMAKERPGCVSYSFNQNINSPTEFIVYEQWQSKEPMQDHIKALYRLYGDPEPGQPMPKKILEMYESAEPAFYNVIGSNA